MRCNFLCDLCFVNTRTPFAVVKGLNHVNFVFGRMLFEQDLIQSPTSAWKTARSPSLPQYRTLIFQQVELAL